MGLLLLSLIFCSIAAGNVVQRGRRQIDVDAIRWDDNIIPFIMESSFSAVEQLKIREAMNHISNNTCILFNDVTGRKDVTYGIKFVYSSTSCQCSGLGRPFDPGFQIISLHTGPAKDCLDTPHHRPQFEMALVHKYSQYDFSSNLHYASHLTWNSSSINPLQSTIVSKDKRYIHAMGNRRGGSFLDFHALNKHYRCYDNQKMDTVKCRHRGILNPNNRSTCLCPEGYAGRRCELRPDNCGYTMNAKHTWDTVTLNIGDPSKGREYKYETCVSWIKAPRGHDVEVLILSVKSEGVGHVTLQEKISCRQYGIEVKIKGNPRPGGPVFCMPDDIQQRFISRTPMAPVILYNRIGYQEYTIQYRATKRSRN